jgi:CxxC motif-containing protein (DUF1111 family)
VDGGLTIQPKPLTCSIATAESPELELGRAAFCAQWSIAADPQLPRFAGVGPLFNATSCSTCHVDGAGGRGPAGDGAAPPDLVVQLEAPSADDSAPTKGDPVYGRVLNTTALNGVQPEGVVMIHYTEREGYYYPSGERWYLRVPHYRIVQLSRGPLAHNTIIKPRLAPPLFGVGLLESVDEAAAIEGAASSRPGKRKSAGEASWQWHQGIRMLGRLGWQAKSYSIRDQTSKAFAREMGLTSNESSGDDCTPAEPDCLRYNNTQPPEVADEIFDAVVAYVRAFAVQAAPAKPADSSLGAALFSSLNCDDCHRPSLPVTLPMGPGQSKSASIAPYTDLRLHDLGNEMTDEDASGRTIDTRWRTAPLWGLGQRLHRAGTATFLHDGRARTPEEAILWHGGEAAHSRRKFVDLGPRSRRALLHWLETL